MFAQYTYIDEQHKLAMTSVIRQQPYVTEPYLAKLYHAALMAFDNEKPPEGIAANCIRQNASKKDEVFLATATDVATGVFIQLSGSKASSEVMLSVGKKWSMQGFDPISNTIQTKLL